MTARVMSRHVTIAFAFLVPVVGVLAPKGIVVLLAVAGGAGFLAWTWAGRPRLPVDRRLLVLLAALASWAAVTAAWAFSPGDALALVASLVAIAGVGIGAMAGATCLDAEQRGSAGNALIAGTIVALVALAIGVVYAWTTGDSLWGEFKTDPLTTLKTGAVVLGLVAWPAVAAAWRRGQRLAAAIGAVAVYAVGALVSSGAAMLAPLIGVAAFAVVWAWPRRGAWFLAAIVVIVALLMPQILSSRPVHDSMARHATTVSSSAAHRFRIWDFVVRKIDDKPIWGWGMDASRAIPGGHRLLTPGVEVLPLHPHNAFLQVRLELGVPGAVIVALLLGAYYAGVVGAVGDRFAAAVIAGATGAYLTAANISYGIWQNWWVATAWALAALTAMVLSPSTSGNATPAQTPADAGRTGTT